MRECKEFECHTRLIKKFILLQRSNNALSFMKFCAKVLKTFALKPNLSVEIKLEKNLFSTLKLLC